MAKPKTPALGSALTNKLVTDGIRVGTAWHFDTESATLEDWKRLAEVWEGGPMLDVINALSAKLDRLENTTPAMQLRINAIRAIHAQLPSTAVDFTAAQIQLLELADFHWTEIMVLRDVMPKAQLGHSFTQGRKRGTEGPIKKAARKIMKARPGMKTAEVWAALTLRPPTGWQALENRLGKYFEGPTAADNMAYARFQNVCSEIRTEEKAKSAR